MTGLDEFAMVALVVCLAMVIVYAITIDRGNSKVRRQAVIVIAILIVCLVFVLALKLNPVAAEALIKTVAPLLK